MFVAQLVFNWLVKLKRVCRFPLFLSVGILAGLSYVTARWFFLPWSIQPALGALVFTYFGYVIRQKDWLFEIPKRHKAAMLPMAGLWALRHDVRHLQYGKQPVCHVAEIFRLLFTGRKRRDRRYGGNLRIDVCPVDLGADCKVSQTAFRFLGYTEENLW